MTAAPVTTIASTTMRFDTLGLDELEILGDLRMPELNLDLLPPTRNSAQNRQSQTTRQSPGSRQNQLNQDTPQNQGGDSLELPDYNPLLD
jgi:hypothetical protein